MDAGASPFDTEGPEPVDSGASPGTVGVAGEATAEPSNDAPGPADDGDPTADPEPAADAVAPADGDVATCAPKPVLLPLPPLLLSAACDDCERVVPQADKTTTSPSAAAIRTAPRMGQAPEWVYGEFLHTGRRPRWGWHASRDRRPS